ncbi:MAG: M28 family peptidase [Acidobacteriota bacterium]
MTHDRSKVFWTTLVLAGLVVGAATQGNGTAASDEPAPNDEARFLSNVRQLTFAGRRSGEGYFSAAGDRLVFQSEREPGNPFFQIYLFDLASGEIRRISTGIGKTTCAWIHPQGDRVLFASTHEDPEAKAKQEAELQARASGQERRYAWDFDEHYELYVRNLADNSLTRLTAARGYDAEASWSPDGRWIVFASNRHAYETTLSAEDQRRLEQDPSYFLDLYLMSSDGTQVRRLTDTPGYDGGPFFSADGRRICWRRFSPDGATAEIFTMRTDGTDVRQLTRLGAMSWAPYFHPSGDYLIFATNLQGFGNFELYLVDAAGEREPVRVTFTDGFDGLPVFSPDGRRLAWTSNRTNEQTSQIFLADWNDAAAREALGLTAAEGTQPAISRRDLEIHVRRLASDEFAGRLTGTAGEQAASTYLAARLETMGLEPAGDDGTYFQSFEFTSGVSLGPDNRLTATIAGTAVEATLDRDWRPLAFSKTGRIESGPVVFAGYGIVAPAEGEHPEYDSFAHLDVQDKWVMVFRFLPEDVSPERRQHLTPFSGLRFKAMAARERGARGLLVVSGPRSKVKQQLVDLKVDAALGATSLAVLSISDEFAARLLGPAGRSLAEIQAALDSGELQPGFELTGVTLAANVDIVYEKNHGRNVLARLRSGGASPPLVLGAHYDHLGRGTTMSTLAREEEKGQIHYGADDNASGVAALLEIAEWLAHLQRQGRLVPRRDLVFAFWSGEEMGMLGANHYVKTAAAAASSSAERIAYAYLNLDMVGRLRERFIVQGVGSSSLWPFLIERLAVRFDLPIAPQNESYLPTDATAFYLQQVPILSAFTGVHEEYHSPRDKPETLNYEGMEQIAAFMAAVARELATSSDVPDYRKMERPRNLGARGGLRAYLGTIPDYAGGGEGGVKLSGVIAGGPAEQAGLRQGDVIVELAGRKIENIYDYTYAIQGLKVGQPVTIVVVRDGERLELTITPGSRE